MILHNSGFSRSHIKMIMGCVTTTNMAVLINVKWSTYLIFQHYQGLMRRLRIVTSTIHFGYRRPQWNHETNQRQGIVYWLQGVEKYV